MRLVFILLRIIALAYAGFCVLLYTTQRSLLFFPTHYAAESVLQPWKLRGGVIGYCREVPNPKAVWLMTHGNGGQADQRSYVLSHLPAEDSFYVVEYPGYGVRSGTPSKKSFDDAALEAFNELKARFPKVPLCLLGESLGSGPACSLAGGHSAPDKIVLIVPFDSVANVASERFPFFPVRWLLKDKWDNLTALRDYRGPVEIYGAINDEVIPFKHARNLAAHLPHAQFHSIVGGHSWAGSPSPIFLSP